MLVESKQQKPSAFKDVEKKLREKSMMINNQWLHSHVEIQLAV